MTTERQARQERIDLQLGRAGWAKGSRRLIEEFLVKIGSPRKVSGFFTEEDLSRLSYLDKFGQPLTGVMPQTSIIDRAYQIEAVKTIAGQIEAARRRFLLVLATGTGKTRVAVGLVELLQRQELIRRVLFLADRRELVKQALGAFKEHLPGLASSFNSFILVFCRSSRSFRLARMSGNSGVAT